MSESFAQSLRVHLVEQTTESWMFWFGLLETYTKAHGNCCVPQLHKTEDGWRLGLWVNNQRARKDTIPPDRRQRLEALPGWSWDPLSDQWEEGFSCLREYSNREGHCRVPDGYKTNDGYRLGTWVGTQRSKKGKMESDRRQRLEALPGWVWRIEK